MDNLLENLNFSTLEKEIVKYWNDNNIYQKIQDKNKDKKLFRFTDGPPFVNSSSLHHGHLLVSFIKDSILRYHRMNGYNVLNKIGYDCHGLPIEMVVDKLLGLNNSNEIPIKDYNKKCKEMVGEYSGSWNKFFDRIGRWIDEKDQYKTMDYNFMKSTWWVFNELYKKDLVYMGSRILPYSIGCKTPLSNFEVAQNYLDVSCKSIMVKFKIKENTYLIAWTTTPWTLVANLALCVNNDIKYISARDINSGEIYITSENSLNKVFNVSKKCKEMPYKIIDNFLGSSLVDTKYEPIFDYFSNDNGNMFRVISDSYVNTESGTGIVHIAPAFGEEDFNVCVKNNIISAADVDNYCPIDDDAKYTNNIYDRCGKYIFDEETNIIAELKSNNKLVRIIEYMHSYPFCWRTNTPIIYRTMMSVFINVTKIKDDMIENNKKVNWIPSNIGSGRFHQWLNNIRDWSVSRNRVFGTPIPLWVSDDMTEIKCVSIDDLDNVTDLHREFVDDITFVSESGKTLKRVPFVFDCWFESGAVPYGQYGFPYDNKNIYDDVEYLSDFICEGLDQTRGWFYTLLTLSTALYNKPPFKNVICSGIILNEKGEKLSKKLNNFTPLDNIIEQYGSDSIRLYLLASPATQGGSFKFKDKDVEKYSKKLYQLVNCFKFLCNLDYKNVKEITSTDVTDKWILERLNMIIIEIKKEIESFDVKKIPQIILDFIEDLANWYIKFNRNRLKGKYGEDDKNKSIFTLKTVFLEMCKIFAPFIPFLSEIFYKILTDDASVHMCEYPLANKYDNHIIKSMSYTQKVCIMTRYLRDQTKTFSSVKKPISNLKIIGCHQDLLNSIKDNEKYFKDEINVLNIEYIFDTNHIKYIPKPNHKNIGQKFGKESNKIKQNIAKLDQNDLKNFIETKIINVCDNELNDDYLTVDMQMNILKNTDELFTVDGDLVVIINTEETELVKELFAYRTLLSIIQQTRKNNKMTIADKFEIIHDNDIIDKYFDKLKEELECDIIKYDNSYLNLIPCDGLDKIWLNIIN